LDFGPEDTVDFFDDVDAAAKGCSKRSDKPQGHNPSISDSRLSQKSRVTTIHVNKNLLTSWLTSPQAAGKLNLN
jgi:hypothetical protein